MQTETDAGDLSNVFLMTEPLHMLEKLIWEIDMLTKEMSV